MKVLHVLDHYKPRSDGYVFRSNSILSNQRRLGIEPVVVTSPKQGSVRSEAEDLDGMQVYRTRFRDSSYPPFLREALTIRKLQKRIETVIEREKPALLHAHSPSLNGIAALLAGRRHKLPVVYEVRAFWEDAAVDQAKFPEKSLKYSVSRYLETALLRRVDAIFTICDGLKRDIADRGIDAGRITIIRNCVENEHFVPQEYDSALAEKLGLQGNPIIGFLGSFFDFEGLDVLLRAFRRVSEIRPNARLLLVGDGLERNNLKKEAEVLGLTDKVVFTGLVPHSEVLRYYSIMDVLVYPRKSLRITELVTPLKPLEAMSMGKLVIGSDVGGIKELVTDSVTGFLFRAGDADHLTALLADILGRTKELDSVRSAAMRQIREKHNWGRTVAEYLPIYQRLSSPAQNRLGRNVSDATPTLT